MLVRRHWLEGRRLRAVDIPIRLSPGHTSTGTFEAAATYLHIIELHFGSGTAGIPECLVASRGAPAACDEHVTSLNLKRALYNQGQLVRERTISSPECYRTEDIVCSIGSFHARRGQFYSANIEILSDAGGAFYRSQLASFLYSSIQGFNLRFLLLNRTLHLRTQPL